LPLAELRKRPLMQLFCLWSNFPIGNSLQISFPGCVEQFHGRLRVRTSSPPQ
jgi:hypothetical protein